MRIWTSGAVTSPPAGRNATIRPRRSSTTGGCDGSRGNVGHDEPDDQQEEEPAGQGSRVAAQAGEWAIAGSRRSSFRVLAGGRTPDPIAGAGVGHVGAFVPRSAASACSLSARR